jgi:hypothetical protein
MIRITGFHFFIIVTHPLCYRIPAWKELTTT